MKACSQRAPTGIRNRALVAVLWRSGLRISAALALERRDVDLDAGRLRVRHGKGDRSRTVGIDEQTAALLARWFDRRQRLGSELERRCSARWRALRSIPATSGGCGPVWRPGRAYRSACTPTGSVTPTRRSSRGRGRRST
jgi:integrase